VGKGEAVEEVRIEKGVGWTARASASSSGFKGRFLK